MAETMSEWPNIPIGMPAVKKNNRRSSTPILND
jgi:hypothetical protein